jgi:hypothetical protein
VRGAGLNFTKNRKIILAVFLAGMEPVTITDLWLRTKKADPRTSYTTVWRLLTALVERGLAHREISPADGSGSVDPLPGRRHPSLWAREDGMQTSAPGVQRLRRHHLPGRAAHR